MAPEVGFQVAELSTLRESPTNARKHHDAQAIQELEESIKAHGILVPLLVRPLDGGKTLEIVAGSRRYRAAKAAKLKAVPVEVRDLSDDQAIEIGLVENLQRENLHPLDEGEAYRRLMDSGKCEAVAIAVRVGKEVTHVYRRMKLLDLIVEARGAFLGDQITEAHATLIARLQPEVQKEALKECFEQVWTTDHKKERALIPYRELARWIEQNVHLDLAKAPWKKEDATLHPPAGSCTACPKRTGASPMLFPDITKKDTCTDRVCFGEKMGLFLVRQKATLEAAGKPWVQLSGEYRSGKEPKKGAPLTQEFWREAKLKSCAHVQTGLIVNGENKGLAVPVCVEGSCKVHRVGVGGLGSRPTKQQREAAKRVRAKHRGEKALRVRVLDAVLKGVPAVLGMEDLRLVAWSMFDRLFHQFQKKVMDRKGWEAKKTRWGGRDYGATAADKIKAMGSREVAQLLVECALIGSLEVGGGLAASGQALFAVAKRHGVDVGKLRKEPTSPGRGKRT
jgi:ParB/RepB/Spo0J family partition protein